MNEPDILLDARDVALAYGGRLVLRDASFTIRAGEFWCVLGPNGSGKSTLLRAMLGLDRPVAGTLWRHPEWARPQRIGFVPQRCELNPALPTTVREFVLLGTVGLALPRRETSDRLDWAIARVGLDDGRRDYWTLSGGERQRALLARALVRRPSLLLLDEPTTFLDRDGSEMLLDLLAELRTSRGVTPVLVTHDETIALRHASHVAALGDGTLAAGSRADMLPAKLP